MVDMKMDKSNWIFYSPPLPSVVSWIAGIAGYLMAGWQLGLIISIPPGGKEKETLGVFCSVISGFRVTEELKHVFNRCVTLAGLAEFKQHYKIAICNSLCGSNVPWK